MLESEATPCIRLGTSAIVGVVVVEVNVEIEVVPSVKQEGRQKK